jgi:hypothetical protein
MFMNYPEPNRAGSHGTSGVGVVIILDVIVNYLLVGWGDAEGVPQAERCHPHYAGGY